MILDSRFSIHAKTCCNMGIRSRRGFSLGLAMGDEMEIVFFLGIEILALDLGFNMEGICTSVLGISCSRPETEGVIKFLRRSTSLSHIDCLPLMKMGFSGTFSGDFFTARLTISPSTPSTKKIDALVDILQKPVKKMSAK